MKVNQKPGRPISSRNVRVIPEFHDKPDIEKLGRALIAIAMRVMDKKKDDMREIDDDHFNDARNLQTPSTGSKEDDMT